MSFRLPCPSLRVEEHVPEALSRGSEATVERHLQMGLVLRGRGTCRTDFLITGPSPLSVTAALPTSSLSLAGVRTVTPDLQESNVACKTTLG